MKFSFSNLRRRQDGTSVVEVLIALAMAGIIVVSIGRVLASVHEQDTSSVLRERALGLAKEGIEVVTEIQNDEFACRCSSDSCSGGTCTRAADSLSCSLPGIYTSCWVEYPVGLAPTLDPLYLDPTGGWSLSDSPPMPIDPTFTRTIAIENVAGDPSRKNVTVTVTWQEKNGQKQLTLSTLLTAWKNL